MEKDFLSDPNASAPKRSLQCLLDHDHIHKINAIHLIKLQILPSRTGPTSAYEHVVVSLKKNLPPICKQVLIGSNPITRY